MKSHVADRASQGRPLGELMGWLIYGCTASGAIDSTSHVHLWTPDKTQRLRGRRYLHQLAETDPNALALFQPRPVERDKRDCEDSEPEM